MLDSLVAVLDHLDATLPQDAQTWRQWRILPVSGGANNLLYRVTNAGEDYAIKYTLRDERNRAQREHDALSALQEAGLSLAPQAILLDQNRYRQPVVVQSWLDGAVLVAPPESDADWAALLHHYCTIHSLTPAHPSIQLMDAVLNMASGGAGKALVYRHAKRLPLEAQPDSLQRLLTWLDKWTPPTWESPPRALCRVDANWRNFIRRESVWASVDWENSGWGDPAFELADLMTHPAYETVASTQWERLVEGYATQMNDSTAILRIQTYYTLQLIWWAVRWARYLYEVPRGLDRRLVSRPDNWQTETEQKYARHVVRTEAHIATTYADG